MSLAERLRELREAAGLSQTSLARQMGVSRNAVSQWESGMTQPSTKRLLELSRVLGVQLDRIMAPSRQTQERIMEAASRLFDRLSIEEVTTEVISAAADVSTAEFEALFGSREELLYSIVKKYNEQTFAEVERHPPRYGTLAARLKYLFRMYFVNDVAHLQLVAALNSYSWQWGDTRERSNAKQLLQHHEHVQAMFREAASQGQIRQGNFRMASELLFAAYTQVQRKAVYEKLDPDRLVAALEPQIAIVLDGFGYTMVPGFADEGQAS